MIEVLNEEPLKAGDTAWWLGADEEFHSGTISGIASRGGQDWAEILEAESTASVRLASCWPTKSACRKAEMRRSNAQAKAYADSIKDVEGLVRFLFQRMDMSALDSYAAEAAAVRRAADLLGIELAGR